MIPNSRDILYLFDFDGTLFGRNDWVSYKENNKSVRKNGPFVVPDLYSIKWYVLTARPKIDKLFVWYICHSRGLHPERIFTSPTWLFPKDATAMSILDYKIEFMKDILLGKKTIPGQSARYSRIFYIDNDLKVIKKINGNRGNFPIQAITVVDFQDEKFNFML